MGRSQGAVLGILRLQWRDVVMVPTVRPRACQGMRTPSPYPTLPPPPPTGAAEGEEEGEGHEEGEARPAARLVEEGFDVDGQSPERG